MGKVDSLTTFDLGPIVDPATGKETNKELYYESKNLTTHGVILGMTGSGKTGLGIVLLEEAGLDKIPAIIIDPKGDMSNLLLTFPHMSPAEFMPWVDPVEAQRQGSSVQNYAEEIAKSWREGLEKSGGLERIQKLRDSVEMAVYTPGNKSGNPISILRSFEAPPKEFLEDDAAFRDRLMSLTSSILGMIGINADPIKSREQIYLSLIIEHYWRQGQNLDLTTLIQLIQKPPFDMVGALDVGTFFPAKDRMTLSVSLNNLLASPGFQSWMEGTPLDINEFLATKEGKPKFSIFSIAHLQDSERMFFVTLLLNEVIAWMRQQPGTSNLRALIYMDEIFGYFPPTSMPPSKTPMLTLLKQARAYGIGVLLATQNPIDLDYKGLANCGTWFIGRLQTDRDKMRLTEGLQAASNGNMDMQTFNQMLANISKRTFIMRSIYESAPIEFKTRWTLSYLRGPLTLAQLQAFKKPSDKSSNNHLSISAEKETSPSSKPIIPIEITELFAKSKTSKAEEKYSPRLLGTAKVHFVDSKNKIDQWKDISLIASVDDSGKTALWDKSEELTQLGYSVSNKPEAGSSFEEAPRGLLQITNYPAFEKTLAAHIYQNQVLMIYQLQNFDLTSKENENEKEFRDRAMAFTQFKWKEMSDKILAKYAEKENVINNRIKNAQDKLTAKQNKTFWERIEAFLSIISTFLQAMVGKKLTKGTIAQAGTSIRRTGRTLGNNGTTLAEEDVQYYQRQLEDLETEKQQEIAALPRYSDPSQIPIENIDIHPRKSDINVQTVSLIWVPK